jgi:predicted dehydrogenase
MLKIAVIGIGHIGIHHARILSNNPEIKLVAISDIDESKSHLANKFHTTFIRDYQNLPDNLNAVIISTPTSSHYQIAKFFLNKNKHVFIEKPLTDNLDDAIKLVNLAEEKKLIIQVGFIEKFNPAFSLYKKYLNQPKFIQAIRCHPFIQRCIDVDIVIDLMIHDIDLITYLLKNASILNIQANGFRSMTNSIDFAYAHLTFDNNCSCILKASRIDTESKRIMNIFQPNGFFSLNFADQSLTITKPAVNNNEKIYLQSRFIKNEKIELIPLELNSFIKAIKENPSDYINSAKDAIKALEIASTIRKLIYQQINNKIHN